MKATANKAKAAEELGEALFWASKCDRLNEASKLLSKGANVNFPHKAIGDEGNEVAGTPLMAAAANGNQEMVKLLINRKADVNLPDPCGNWRPIHGAALTGRVGMIELLISKGAKLDVWTKTGWQPLHFACHHGQKDAAICLLDNGADVNACDETGWTPLLRAVNMKFIEIVKVLLSSGANPDCPTNRDEGNGKTALHMCAEGGELELCKVLVHQGGAKLDLLDFGMATPIELAAKKGHLSVVLFLVEAGADVETVYGGTLLHIAALNGHLEIVKLLMARAKKEAEAFPLTIVEEVDKEEEEEEKDADVTNYDDDDEPEDTNQEDFDQEEDQGEGPPV